MLFPKREVVEQTMDYKRLKKVHHQGEQNPHNDHRFSHQNDARAKRSQPSSLISMKKPDKPTSKMEMRSCCAKRRSNASKAATVPCIRQRTRTRQDNRRDSGQAADPM